MITIKTLMDIEDVLLRADNDLRYSYSMNEVIKSEKCLKEIGEITNLFLSLQIEYGKVNDTKDEEYKQKLVDYHNKLISDEIDIDITNYLSFIKEIEERIKDKDYYEKAKKILAL
jgi:hypothetical protein